MTGRRRGGAATKSFAVALAFALLGAACSDDKGPAEPGGASPTGFPSATNGGVVGSPFPTVSYSPYGFETCEPDHIDMPEWIPDDLPLPEGIYATASDTPTAGYERVFLIVPSTTTIPDFARTVTKVWPKFGYQIGRGDSEPGEIEAEFSKPPATGAFKVQATACHDPAYSVMYLIYAPNGPAPLTPSPS